MLLQLQTKVSNIGIRPLYINFVADIYSNYVVSLTDGFSLSLGFIMYFEKNNSIKLVGAFHKLSVMIETPKF